MNLRSFGSLACRSKIWHSEFPVSRDIIWSNPSSRMILKKYIFTILALCLAFTSPASAVTAEDLQRQIADLQAQIVNLRNSQGLFQFSRDLYLGLQNDSDVRRLQDFLIKGGYLKISSSTGNFYTLTREAVWAYQLRNGIPGTGYFGPLTRAKVNETLRAGIQPQAQPVPPQTVETPETLPIEIPPEARLPQSFEQRTDNQASGELRYDLNLIGRNVQVLINVERAKVGLGELIWDGGVAEVARLHSADQAEDNVLITNPDVLCHYPLIRHEGIRGGYSMVDRLRAGGISYRSAGENIVMFSTAKNLLYTYRSDAPPPPCKDVPDFPHTEGTREERLALFQSILDQAIAAVVGLEKINWVNKEWLTYEEIAAKAVSLWMNSPGHRENILRSVFNYAGVGVVKVNDYLIVTQNFVGQPL